MSFTPGPWSLHHMTGNGLGGSYDHYEIRVNGRTFVTLYGDRSDQAKDDARLMAAAPELLDALDSISSLYESDEGCRALPQYVAARAAIAKARGEVA